MPSPTLSTSLLQPLTVFHKINPTPTMLYAVLGRASREQEHYNPRLDSNEDGFETCIYRAPSAVLETQREVSRTLFLRRLRVIL